MSAGPAFPPPPSIGGPRLGAYRELASREGDLVPRAVAPKPAPRPRKIHTELERLLLAAHDRGAFHERVEETFSAVPLALASSAAFVAVAGGLSALEHGSSSVLVLVACAVLVAAAACAFEAKRRTFRRSLVFARGHVGVFRRGVLEAVLGKNELVHDDVRTLGSVVSRFVRATLHAAGMSLLASLLPALAAGSASGPARHVLVLGALASATLAIVTELWTGTVSARVVLPLRGARLRVPAWRLELATH